MLKVTVALDDSPESRAALEWAAKTWRKTSKFQIVTVVLPVIMPTIPLAAGADMVNPNEWANLNNRQEQYATQVADEATLLAIGELEVPKENVTEYVLRPTGGASGVGHSIVEFVKQEKPDVLVVGSRNMDGLQRTFMGLVGAGSVSDYVLQNVDVPVLSVHWTGAAPAADADHAVAAPTEVAAPSSSRQIVVSLDDSKASRAALEWTLRHIMVPGQDTLHIVSVSQQAPMPVLEDVGAMLSTREHEEEQRKNWEAAKSVLTQAATLAAEHGVSDVVEHPLLPQGGASDVGDSIVQYANLKHADLIVLGSRGMGAVKRALMNFIGMGSVSEYVMHHATCPVLIIKSAH